MIRPWLAMLGALVLVAACKQEQPVYNTRFSSLGGTVDLSIIGVNQETAQRAAGALEGDFTFLDGDWHTWQSGALERVNRLLASGRPFAAPPSLLPLIRLARDYAGRSGDLFNPAIGGLIDLWGLHTDPLQCRPPPSAEAIRALLRANPRMADLELRGIMLSSRNPQVQLDFDQMLRGYGIDLAIARLREMGIHNATVKAGNGLRTIGDRDGQPWRIPIRLASGRVLGVVEMSGDESLFTVSDSDRSCVYEGESYHAVLDPRTGRPATGTRSVTVLQLDGVAADAAAHALFIAGPEEWVRVARSMGIHQALLVDGKGTLYMTPAMAKRVQLVDKEPDVQLSEPL
jgi:FAD:protein FMN transferase